MNMFLQWLSRDCKYTMCPVGLMIILLLLIPLGYSIFYANKNKGKEDKLIKVMILFMVPLILMLIVGAFSIKEVWCSDVLCDMFGCWNETSGEMFPITEESKLFIIITLPIIVGVVLVITIIQAYRRKNQDCEKND